MQAMLQILFGWLSLGYESGLANQRWNNSIYYKAKIGHS